MNREKPFDISKKVVWEAYQHVRANKGAAGVDAESIADFEKDLKGNLYKIWNRMSSYFPPPLRAVVIPKDKGGQRVLGVPTVCSYCTSCSVVWESVAVAMNLHRPSYAVGEFFFFLRIQRDVIRPTIGPPCTDHIAFNPIVHYVGAHGKLFGNLTDGQFSGQLEHGHEDMVPMSDPSHDGRGEPVALRA